MVRVVEGWYSDSKCGLAAVEENTENVANPLHEACKRGNMAFLIECINNGVSVRHAAETVDPNSRLPPPPSAVINTFIICS